MAPSNVAIADQADVVITVGLQLANMKSKYKRIMTDLKAQAITIQEQISKATAEPARGFKARHGVFKGAYLKQLQLEAKETKQLISQTAIKASKEGLVNA